MKALAAALIAHGQMVFAAPPLPAGTLPVPQANWVASGQAASALNGSMLTIKQATARAILNWQSFNIANGSAVKFVQPGSTSATLNRIFDANPSVIQGQLSANGQVYLINQNGIIFDKGAQVSVGSLIASTLNITDDLFNNGLLTNPQPSQIAAFAGFANGLPTGMVVVESGAQISAASGGRVMLLAPSVSNNGVIRTPDGQTILAAGGKVYLAASNDPGLRGLLVEVDNGGSAQNLSLGQIIAERGNATLVGLAVNQSGRITATTSVNVNGSIRLLARDTVVDRFLTGGVVVPEGSRYGSVTLGEGSVTAVVPVVGDSETIKDSQAFNASTIEIAGKTVELQRNSAVIATSGNISIAAQTGFDFQLPGQTGADGVQIYLAEGSIMDASGSRDVQVPAERNSIAVELRGNELRDSPLQRNGFLRGQTIYVDARKGTPLADISGYLDQIERGVGERTALGGAISLKSEGDIVLRQGSTIDVSGGSIDYLGGVVRTTQLLSQGRIVDIGSATPDRIYDGFADSFTVVHSKWGVTQIFTSPFTGQFTPGYTEGKNAGSVSILARGLVLDGSFVAKTTAGPYQRVPGTQPLGGQLVIGDASQAADPVPDFRTAAVSFVERATPLPASFAFGDRLPDAYAADVQIPVALFRDGGFNRVAIYSNGEIRVPAGVSIELAPGAGTNSSGAAQGSSISLNGRSIDMQGTLLAPSGNVALNTYNTFGALQDRSAYGVTLGAGAAIDVRGRWVNDLPGFDGGAPMAPLAIDGGAVSIASIADLTLAAGSVIDVSAGGHVGTDRTLAAGNAGSIALSTGRLRSGSGDRQTSVLTLDGTLLGYGLTRGRATPGGALSVSASSVVIGAAASSPTQLALSAEFFATGGFSEYVVNGQDGVRLADSLTIAPVARVHLADARYVSIPTGGSVDAFAGVALLPLEQRPPASITLTANSKVFGDMNVGEQSAIRVDPTGSIKLVAGNQLTVYGTLEARAGSITLATLDPAQDDSYAPGQSIWLAPDARVLAGGYFRPQIDPTGMRRGDVLDGGTVTISAGRGYVITAAGSSIDVSGTSTRLDIAQPGVVGPVLRPRLVAGDAGSIDISAQEGLLLDGSLRAQPGGAGARGGSLALTLDPRVSGNISYPRSDSSLVVSQGSGFVPAGLHPGQVVDAHAFDPSLSTLSHRGFVSAAALSSAGFDDVSLVSPDYIVFNGAVSLRAQRSVSLDALALTGRTGAQVRIAAPYVSIASTSGFAPKRALAGDAQLEVAARLIDLEGDVVLQGFAGTTLASQGDIRLKGLFIEGGPATLEGSLVSMGNITLAANQIYPTTLADFTIEVRDNASGIITVLPGAGSFPVQSAAGRLTLTAANIDQRGVLKAPFGEIVLNAADSLTLADGSLTSVSGEGQQVLFGRTDLSGNDYIYQLSPSTRELLTQLPDKRISLSAAAVQIGSRATLDLSGGGTLLAHEFTPGPGGSKDVLDPANSPNTFAVLPGYRSEFAPYDHQEYLSGVKPALNPGDQVYLTGADGLAAGYYTLLPARYALLPGAFLVSQIAGKTDLLPSQGYRLVDGGHVVSGYRTAFGMNGQTVGDTRSSGFLVRPGSYARQQSEYLETTAGSFFADVTSSGLPADAGALSVLVTRSLQLDGNVIAAPGSGGRGAHVDISAPRISVVDTRGPDDGSVQIEAGVLDRMTVDSLLLGGVRERTDSGWLITPGASHVVMRNNIGPALTGSEVVLVATDRVEIRDGARIEASGAPRTGDDLTFAAAADGTVAPGALVRVSSADRGAVQRLGSANSASQGVVVVGADSSLMARSLDLDATLDTSIATSARLSAQAVSLAASHISLGAVPIGTAGLTLTGDLATQLQQVSDLALRSYSTLDLYGNAVLGALDPVTNKPVLSSLSIESAGIVGFDNAGETAVINAGTMKFSNPSSIAPPALSGGGGKLEIAASSIELAAGAKSITGFDTLVAIASGDIVFSGQGGLSTRANTTLTAARVTATPHADQSLDAGNGTLTILPADGQASAIDSPAATAQLALSGRSVSTSGLIDVEGGHLTLSATGAGSGDDVVLQAGSRIVASGFVKNIGATPIYGAGGTVTLSSASGNVTVGDGALIDVSGAQGRADAGTFTVSAVQGHVTLAGTLQGAAADGFRGGRATVDALELAAFSDLNRVLAAGGFGDALDFRARSGNAAIGAADVVTARSITISADGGAIDIAGKLDASGAKAGQIVVSAAGNLTVSAGANLAASSNDANADGGKVELATSAGTLNMLAGASVSLGGGVGGKGGSLLLRAPRKASNDIAIGQAAAAISGAAEVVAVGVKVYDNIQRFGTATGAGNLAFNTVATDNAAWMANASGIRNRLGWTDASFHVRPGVEVRSTGDLTLTGDWNLFSATRPGGEPGVLTLRAAGNLKLNGSLSDAFSTALPTGALQSGESWSYRLISGADLAAADVHAVRPLAQLDAAGTGDVVLAAGKLVRTGTGAIDIAAGRDVNLASSASVIYTAGVPTADLPGVVRPRIQESEGGRTVFNIVPVFPTGGGDVSIVAQRDVIGVPGSQLIGDWLYRRTGGLTSATSYDYANPQTIWWPRFNTFQEGVGALGGGDVVVSAGRDVSNFSVVIPTNGRLGGDGATVPSAANLVVQGGGDLTVESGRDILSGVFYVGRGIGTLTAQGGIISGYSASTPDGGSVPVHTTLALGDGRFDLTAGSDIQLETVFNPTLIRQFATQPARPLNQQSSFSTYAAGSSVQGTSLGGGVTLYNNESSALTLTAPQTFGSDGNNNLDGITLYPGSLALVALGGDVIVRSAFNLYPSASGNLRVLASGSVLVGGTLDMLDTAPARFPRVVNPVATFSETVFLAPGRADSGIIAHSNPPLHMSDDVPAMIVADSGDVFTSNLSSIVLPKRADISAGRDLRDLNLTVQNLHDTDVTTLTAGRDLVFASPRRESGAQETNTSAIQIGGPGRLEIVAGRDVDLGTSSGLISRGNLDNPFLDEAGAAIVVMAGLGTDASGAVRLPDSAALYVNVRLQQYGDTLPSGLSASEVDRLLGAKRAELTTAFDALSAAAQLAAARETLFSELKATGRAFATTGNYDRGYRAIDWLFPATDSADRPIAYQGDIKLFFSQIKTEQGGDIELLAPGGLVNAGLANPGTLTKSAAQLGVVTVDGGSIRSYSNGDFLVNQSRVFTLGGGDILLWSSEGNIDAGKGAKTASATPPPQLKIDTNGNFSLDITESIQGSGIGVLLAKAGATPGDVDLIAPKGEVNAGDAGIRVAGNLNIAALRVVGADNIKVGGISTGVPVAPTTTLSAATAGMTNTTADATKAAEQATQSVASNASGFGRPVMPSFITVEVLGIGEDK